MSGPFGQDNGPEHRFLTISANSRNTGLVLGLSLTPVRLHQVTLGSLMNKLFLTTPLAQRLAVLVSAVLFGAVCTHWALQVRQGLQPEAPADALGATPALPVQDPVNLHLFGVNADTSGQAVAEPPPNLRLIGVIAGSPGRAAVAVLSVDGKSAAARPGDTLGGNTVLKAVARDRVVVETAGQTAEIVLGAAAAPPGTPLPGVLPAGATLPGGPPPGTALPGNGRPLNGAQLVAPPFKLDVQSMGPNHYGLSKGELSRALSDPKLAASMGRATPSGSGGLLLEEVPAGSLSDRLGLRAGDVLRSANGQTLVTLADLPRLYQEFGTTSAVRLEIVRLGQPTLLQYTVRP